MYPPVNEEDTVEVISPTFMFTGYQSDFQNIYQNLNFKYNQQPDEEWIMAKQEVDTVSTAAIKFERNIVPKVTGMGLKDAIYLLENAGLSVVATGKGKVRKQSLDAGTGFNKGDKIYLELN